MDAVSALRLEQVTPPSPHRYRALRLGDVERTGLVPPDVLAEMRVVTAVLPFRTNSYVLEELASWRSSLTGRACPTTRSTR